MSIERVLLVLNLVVLAAVGWVVVGEGRQNRAAVEALRAALAERSDPDGAPAAARDCRSEDLTRILGRLDDLAGALAADGRAAPPAATAPAAAPAAPAPAVRAPDPARFGRASQADWDRYGADAKTIEDLYAQGMRDRRGEAGQKVLRDLIERYPDSNRAGCASVALASEALAKGDPASARQVLSSMIDGGRSPAYKDGSLVLPRALILLGQAARDTGDDAAAQAAWRRVVQDFAGEVDGHGSEFAAEAEALLKGNP